MNMATSLNMMVKMGAFEKMPKEGSISATELGGLINLEPSVIGIYISFTETRDPFRPPDFIQTSSIRNNICQGKQLIHLISPSHENAH